MFRGSIVNEIQSLVCCGLESAALGCPLKSFSRTLNHMVINTVRNPEKSRRAEPAAGYYQDTLLL